MQVGGTKIKKSILKFDKRKSLMYIVSERSQTKAEGDMTQFTKRQQQIIQAAIELIADKGIQQLTIKNLSKKIGIAESAIYRHFASKMDILLGILALFNDNKIQINRLLQEMDVGAMEKLKSMLLKRFDYFAHNRAIASVIFSEELFRNDRRLSERIYEVMKANQQVIVDIIYQGQQSGEIRDDIPAQEVAFMITGALRLIVTHWRLSDFTIDLRDEGQKLWFTIEKLIAPQAGK